MCPNNSYSSWDISYARRYAHIPASSFTLTSLPPPPCLLYMLFYIPPRPQSFASRNECPFLGAPASSVLVFCIVMRMLLFEPFALPGLCPQHSDTLPLPGYYPLHRDFLHLVNLRLPIALTPYPYQFTNTPSPELFPLYTSPFPLPITLL